MAKVSFSNYQQAVDTQSDKSGVGFFTLKNDGDEAIVRIMHNSTEDFDINTVHPVETPNDKVKFRNVNCLRNANDPVENCPFCAAGTPLANKFYIHLIQYTPDEKGQMIGRPMVWERSMAYVYTLKSLIDEYGPLPTLLFKIKRSGAAGSRDTKYSILFASPNVYPQERFPVIGDVFANYNVIGHGIMNKSFQDMMFFLQSGGFPEIAATPKTDAPVIPQQQYAPVNVPQPQYVPVAPAQTAPAPFAPPTQTAPTFVPPQYTPVTPTVTTPYPPVNNPVAQNPATFTPGTGAKMPWEDNTTAGSPVKPTRVY